MSAVNYPISFKFVMQVRISIPKMKIWPKKSKFCKFKTADGRHIENGFWRARDEKSHVDHVTKTAIFRRLKMAGDRRFENSFFFIFHPKLSDFDQIRYADSMNLWKQQMLYRKTGFLYKHYKQYKHFV